MKSSFLLWLGGQVRSLGAQERVLVTKGMAQGKLGAQGITHEVWRSLRRWTLGDWVVSTLIFLVLMSLTMTKTWGSYLWLGVAPLANALMLLLIKMGLEWQFAQA
ncbi:MAG: hypothetical protein EBT07_15835 [Actinobacteria bacterium]|nr:hypothetical protein [Actinomycetota bacterium]